MTMFLNNIYIRLVGISMFVLPLIDKCTYTGR